MLCRSRANEPASQKAKKTEKRNTKLKAESESFFFNLQPSVQVCDKFSSFFCREKKERWVSLGACCSLSASCHTRHLSLVHPDRRWRLTPHLTTSFDFITSPLATLYSPVCTRDELQHFWPASDQVPISQIVTGSEQEKEKRKTESGVDVPNPGNLLTRESESARFGWQSRCESRVTSVASSREVSQES